MELEGILRIHDEIMDAAVIGVPDERAGELPKAYVVKTHNSRLSENDVMEFVNERIASYKSVQEVEFIPAIPKSEETGNIQRIIKKKK